MLSQLKVKDKLRPAGGDTTISCNKSDKRKKCEKFNQSGVGRNKVIFPPRSTPRRPDPSLSDHTLCYCCPKFFKLKMLILRALGGFKWRILA